jgi:hypothetical protein
VAAIRGSMDEMREIAKFLRANPQAFVLLLICAILGVGTFLAVVFGLAGAGSTKTTGEPSDSIAILRAALPSQKRPGPAAAPAAGGLARTHWPVRLPATVFARRPRGYRSGPRSSLSQTRLFREQLRFPPT